MVGRIGSRMLTFCAAIGIAAFAISGCAESTRNGAGPNASPSPLTGDVGQLNGASGSASPGTRPGGGSTATQTPTHATPTTGSGGATIVYFKVTGKPACPVVGDANAPFSTPGQDVTLSWKVTGASGIALSIDDPGFFAQHHSGTWDEYGRQDSVTLSFPCDTSQPTTTHKYTIDTLGSSSYKEKTITVSAPSNP